MWNRTTVQNAACRPIAPAGNSVYNLYLNGASLIFPCSVSRDWRTICPFRQPCIWMVAVGSKYIQNRGPGDLFALGQLTVSGWWLSDPIRHSTFRQATYWLSASSVSGWWQSDPNLFSTEGIAAFLPWPAQYPDDGGRILICSVPRA